MTIVALAATGEMGASIGRRIVQSGGRALACIDGRSQASIDRAKSAGVETGSFKNIIESSEVYLSIVPPGVAEQVADEFINIAATASRVPIFIDCNAVAPVTLQRIAARFHAAGLIFGDGAIVGLPPISDGAGPRLYLSGNIVDAAVQLRGVGLDTRHMSRNLGDASALKMAYAGLTKGLQALAAGILCGANDAKVLDALSAEVRQSLPGLFVFLSAALPRMPRKAGRWEHEMLEIATFLQRDDGVATMFIGAAKTYRDVATAQHTFSSVLPQLIDRFISSPS